jgi:uncharacterized membrane protein
MGLLSGAALFLLMVRLKLTHSFFYLFLAWNLFLAVIPYAISVLLTSRPKTSKFTLGCGLFLWLLFLPNAPYIVTDFIHLQHSEAIISYDIIMISCFAISGLYFYVISLQKMRQALAPITSEGFRKLLFFVIPFLVGFGIYLGRFLRWNSWDILQQPDALLKDIVSQFLYPKEHVLTWIITLGFGFVLLILDLLLERFRKKSRN